MDGAVLASIDIAIRKASTAVLFQANSGSVWDYCKPGAPAPGLELTNGGLAPFGGGIPPSRWRWLVRSLAEQVVCPVESGPRIELGLDLFQRENLMPRQRFTPEQIIGKLREVEVVVARGATISEACRGIGVSEQTLYRWRREYGGMKVDQARRLKELEAENIRLKKLVADLSLDKAILKEAAKVTF
jgi:putative transposase